MTGGIRPVAEVPGLPQYYRHQDGSARCRSCDMPTWEPHSGGCWVWRLIEQTIRGGGGVLDPGRADAECSRRGPDAVTEAAEAPRTALEELTDWWVALAREEATKVAPKAVEYGATDLAEIGRQLVAAGAKPTPAPTYTAGLAELGVYFYVLGKLARWTDAVATGRRVSDDTLFDIGIYIRMAQRIRAAGSWPGVNLQEEK